MQGLSRAGCHRTALECAKLLLALQPEDPMGVLCMMDYLAIRAGELHTYTDTPTHPHTHTHTHTQMLCVVRTHAVSADGIKLHTHNAAWNSAHVCCVRLCVCVCVCVCSCVCACVCACVRVCTRTGRYEYLHSLVEGWEADEGLAYRPNIAYGLALASYRIEQQQQQSGQQDAQEGGRKAASRLLLEAILMHPSVVPK